MSQQVTVNGQRTLVHTSRNLLVVLTSHHVWPMRPGADLKEVESLDALTSHLTWPTRLSAHVTNEPTRHMKEIVRLTL